MLTDNDLYNFTMGQLIWRNFIDVEVEYSFTCRSKTDLCGLIDPEDLIHNLKLYQESSSLLRVEYLHLRSLGIFEDAYLQWLNKQTLPTPKVEYKNGKIEITVQGQWAKALFWETPILYTVNYLANANRPYDIDPIQFGLAKLEDKIRLLAQHPEVKFLEFGSRRRHSADWQSQLLHKLKKTLPDQLIGTSNVWYGFLYDIPVRGTIAHQLYMVLAAIYLSQDATPESLILSMQVINKLWQDEYKGKWNDGLLVALPDTYGSKLFLDNFEGWLSWKGFRQDSGDPFEFGKMIINAWEEHGIDPQTKMLCFSDGLSLQEMIKLAHVFGTRTQVTFGWGTNLTNDVGFQPISMIVKPTRARYRNNWANCVKLSDNLLKATGDPKTVEFYKSLIGYRNIYSQEALY